MDTEDIRQKRKKQNFYQAGFINTNVLSTDSGFNMVAQVTGNDGLLIFFYYFQAMYTLSDTALTHLPNNPPAHNGVKEKLHQMELKSQGRVYSRLL